MDDKLNAIYQVFFKLIPEGLLVLSPEGMLLDANTTICSMLGYAHNALIGRHLSNICKQTPIDSSSLAARKAGLNEMLENFQLQHKNGSCFNTRLSSAKLPDGNVLAMVRDRSEDEGDITILNRLAAIVESSDDAIISKDLNSIITSWNAGAERIFGYSSAQMVGSSIMRLIPEDREDEEKIILEKIMRGERVDHFETQRLTRDQRLIDVSVTVSPVKDAAGRIVGASKVARDISRQKQHERELEKMTLLYAALAQINQDIVRSQTRDELLHQTCRLLVEYGGVQMVSIGWLDPDNQQLLPVAAHADALDIEQHVYIYNEELTQGSGPVAIAWRNDTPYICNRTAEDPAVQPWRSEIEQLGYRASATFPIRQRGQPGGVLNIFVSQADFFLDDEIRLLEECVKDITFALDSIALEEARQQSEKNALNEESFSDAIIQSLPGVVVFFNEQGQLLRWNKNLNVVSGYSDGEIAAMHPLDFFPNEHRLQVGLKIAEVFDSGETMTEAPLLSCNGISTPYLFTGRRIEFKGKPCLLGIGIDISERRKYEQQLQEQDRLLKDMSAMTHIGGWEFDPETGKGNWTEEVAHIHEVDPATETSTAFGLNFFKGEHREKIEKALQQAVEQGTAYDLELQMVTAKGQLKWVRTMSHPIMHNGKVIKVVGAIQDITEHKLAEIRFRRLNRVKSVLSQINSLIVRVQNREELYNEVCKIATTTGEFRMAMLAVVDRDTGRINPVAWRGMDSELQDSIKKLLSSSAQSSATLVAKAMKDRQPVVSNDCINDPRVRSGKKYAQAGVQSIAVLPLVVTHEVRGILALFANEAGFFREEEMQLLEELTGDISFAIDHIDKQDQLNYLAYYDSLTGLANRSLFLERVSQFIRNTRPGQKLALLLFDLERFKTINDSLGIAAGDALLVQFATWLADYFKDASLLARTGADHFAAVIPAVIKDDAVARRVEAITAALSEKVFVVHEHELHISIKMGIALYPDDGDKEEILFRNAEAAQKLAKKSGQRYLFHTQTMTDSVAAKLSLENLLRHAVDNEEFVLHYQPKVNLMNGSIADAEALIRWNSPHKGLVAPVEFIPILEETGMIYEVGRWALGKAVDDSLRWRKGGFPAVRIAVNVSPLQLRNPGFIREIENKISVDDQAANRLQLEITESLIMENVEHNIAVLQAIRSMGVTIAIDDFGTGFSSLNYLVKLPLDTLKIDRAFVVSMMNGPRELALVSTTINLAHALELNVVAEGVETEEQSRLLRLLGCDQIQGFVFSKPVTADVFQAKFLGAQSAS